MTRGHGLLSGQRSRLKAMWIARDLTIDEIATVLNVSADIVNRTAVEMELPTRARKLTDWRPDVLDRAKELYEGGMRPGMVAATLRKEFEIDIDGPAVSNKGRVAGWIKGYEPVARPKLKPPAKIWGGRAPVVPLAPLTKLRVDPVRPSAPKIISDPLWSGCKFPVGEPAPDKAYLQFYCCEPTRKGECYCPGHVKFARG